MVGVNKECEVSHRLERFMNSSKPDMLVRDCLKPRAQGLQDFLKDLQLPCLCPQPVVAYSAWLQMDGIFCEDPIGKEALMPPCPDFCVTFNVANFSPGLLRKVHLAWRSPVAKAPGYCDNSGGIRHVCAYDGKPRSKPWYNQYFPLSALYVFPDPACW